MRILLSAAAAAFILTLPGSSQAQDASAWGGYNIGVQFSTGNGFQDYGGTTYDLEGESYGIFVGYMIANGAWAYGAELSYADSEFYEIDAGGSPDRDYTLLPSST